MLQSKLVPCVLVLKSYLVKHNCSSNNVFSLLVKDYQALPPPEESSAVAARGKRSGQKGEAPNPREPKVQGALILQSLLRLKEPYCLPVVDRFVLFARVRCLVSLPCLNSIHSLSIPDLMAVAHNATSSRVLDALLESPTVPFKAKRRFVMSLIGHYHTLVDDRIGSRVGDRCWAFADTYLRVSTVCHEAT